VQQDDQEQLRRRAHGLPGDQRGNRAEYLRASDGPAEVLARQTQEPPCGF